MPCPETVDIHEMTNNVASSATSMTTASSLTRPPCSSTLRLRSLGIKQPPPSRLANFFFCLGGAENCSLALLREVSRSIAGRSLRRLGLGIRVGRVVTKQSHGG